jgi:ubiquinone/menaquinone biosynthesis C-methylase UbiE
MNALYLSEPVRAGLGSCLRPGGEILTRRSLELIRPKHNDVILDAGCGAGATLSMLQGLGFRNVVGIDLEGGLLQEARTSAEHIAQADLASLPMRESCFDMVLAECVWNLTEKKTVLGEFFRVLRPGGYLALSDIFLRAGYLDGAWPVRCCFSQATLLETVRNMVENSGFRIELLEDHSVLLKQAAAEFVFAHGSLHGFWQAVTGDANAATDACRASSAAHPGLFLLIARKGM